MDEIAIPRFAVHIITLFPKLFDSWLSQGVVSRAIERGVASISLVNLRNYGVGRHLVTDDYPFGGGAGMVMKPEPLFAAVESLAFSGEREITLLSPRGRRFDHRVARELSAKHRLVLIAGHYEGVDERVREHLVSDDISIGDFVLSAGELAAMVVTDAVVRLLPGALADASTAEESFVGNLLEYPQYTRPADFRGWAVPDVLLSGHHGRISAWRHEQSLRTTFDRRPDLLEDGLLCAQDRRRIENWRAEG